MREIKKSKSLNWSISIIIMALISLGIISSISNAQEWSRKGKGEFYIVGQFMGGDKTTADVYGEEFTMNFDDTIAGGLGYGYNVNDHFNINSDIFYGRSDINSDPYGIDVRADTDMSGVDVNLDFNILKSRLTPLITGGIGWVNFRGDFNGYDFNETDFSYNIGGGVRWDVTNYLLLKAAYRLLWTKLEDTKDSLRFDVITLNIGYIF